MIETKGLETIVTNEKIDSVEKESKEFIMILDNLFLDISVEFNDEFTDVNVLGTYYDAVHDNMKSGKQYTYYLKYDSNTHKAINSHMQSHFYKLKDKYKDIKEPIFVLIPANEFSFFSDIYIYIKIKKEGNKLMNGCLHLLKKGQPTICSLIAIKQEN